MLPRSRRFSSFTLFPPETGDAFLSSAVTLPSLVVATNVSSTFSIETGADSTWSNVSALMSLFTFNARR